MLYTPKFHYRFQKTPTFVPILSQTNTVNTLPNSFNFSFNIIPSSMLGLRGVVFEGISDQKLHDT